LLPDNYRINLQKGGLLDKVFEEGQKPKNSGITTSRACPKGTLTVQRIIGAKCGNAVLPPRKLRRVNFLF
jgi:hypothetical protein